MLFKISAIAFFAGLAAAVHAPVGDPKGNPTRAPEVGEIVEAGKPYEIKWDPTTTNTLSILLLRGPSENAVPLGAPLVEGLANKGSFTWTPSLSLEDDVTHYGLQLIDDVTGQYQYSPQFGISNDNPVSSSAAPSSTGTDYPVETPSSSKGYPVTSANVTSDYPTSIKTSSHVLSTGYPVGNSSIVLPTKTPTVPASLKSSASVTGSATGTGTAPPQQSTNAASDLRAGLGLAGAIAGLVFAL